MSNKQSDQVKALALVQRYARLQSMIKRWRKKVGIVFDKCERPIKNEVGEVKESGCMHVLRKHQVNGRLPAYSLQNEDGFVNLDEAMNVLDFCRACRCAFRLNAYVKRMRRKRGVALGAMKRLGSRQGGTP